MIAPLRVVFWLGVLMLFVPFLGIPNTWKGLLAALVGILLIFCTFRIRKSYKRLKLSIRKLEQTISEHQTPSQSL